MAATQPHPLLEQLLLDVGGDYASTFVERVARAESSGRPCEQFDLNVTELHLDFASRTVRIYDILDGHAEPYHMELDQLLSIVTASSEVTDATGDPA